MQLFKTLTGLGLTTLLAACGGGGSDAPPPSTTIGNLSGDWNVSQTITATSGSCPFTVGDVLTDAIVVEHDVPSGRMTIDPSTPFELAGTLSDTTLNVSGAGVTLSITFAPDGQTFTGNGSQTLSGCTVDFSLAGSLDGGGGPAPLGDLSDNWDISQTITATSGTCPFTVGDVETGSIMIVHDVPSGQITIDPGSPDELVGTLNGASLNASRSDLSISITFASDGQSFTGTGMQSVSVGGISCSVDFSVTGSRDSGGGGGPTGAQADAPLNITASWNNDADFDLQVREPGGNLLTSFQASMFGGVHSGDRVPCFNSVPNEESASYSSAPAGNYEATAFLFSLCNNVPSNMVLTITPTGASPIVQSATFDGSGSPSELEASVTLSN